MILRWMLNVRVIALLVAIAIPVLLFTGIVSVRMEDGRPKVTFNRQRAAEVREKTVNKVKEIRREHSGDKTPIADFASDIGLNRQETAGERFQETVGEMGDTFGEQFENLSDNVGENFEQARQFDFGSEEKKSGFHPFQKIKEKTEKWRR